MNYSEVLQKYLLRIARGELLETTSVLPLVKAAKVFLPQIKNISDGDVVKVTFPILNKDGNKYIPVYLSRSNSASYAGTMTNLRSQINDPIELKGETLFQIIPNDLGIIIEPSSSLEVVFTKTKLHNFISPERGESRHFNEENPTAVDKIINNSEIQEAPNLQVISGGKKAEEIAPSTSNIPAADKVEGPGPLIDKHSISKIEADLIEVLELFPAINEAYILEHASPHSELILGLLAKDWSGDERFRVIENVALLSKQIFGYAGAIEVYDDLHDTHSSSWDLFKMIPPFYTKSDEHSDLNQDIEISSSKRGIRGSMSRITKSSIKILSGIASK